MKNNLIDRYINSLKGLRRSENTIESYARQLNFLNDYLEANHGIRLTAEQAKEVKGYMLDDYMNSLDHLSDSSRNVYISYIKAFFKYACDNGFIEEASNPAKALRHVRIVVDEVADEGRIADNVYTPEDVQALMDSIGKRNGIRNRAMVAIMLGSGLRISELCSLNLGDIRGMENGMFACRRKGGGRYIVTLSPFVAPYLAEYMETMKDKPDDYPLFTTERGQRMNRVTGYRMIASLQNKIGKATGAHRLRHAFLSALNNACGNTAIVRDVASHGSVSTTNRYMHTTLEQRRNAVSRLPWGQPPEQ